VIGVIVKIGGASYVIGGGGYWLSVRGRVVARFGGVVMLGGLRWY
jgi:hypothetical protein